MSTNFYLHVNVCGHCGRSAKVLHLGKRTARGFLWRGYRNLAEIIGADGSIEAVFDWRRWIFDPASRVIDEYGDSHDPAEFYATASKASLEISQYGEFS